ncbi:MAG: cupin domain-containing protein [Myxococcales bacterium]|nr:MAG: cupin domain-containing protein [Myxococcales bacterium]
MSSGNVGASMTRMSDTKATPPMIVSSRELSEEPPDAGHYGAASASLTPSMRRRGGALGVNRVRLKKGTSGCPFHHHLREDEVFYVLEGRGVLRYGEELHDIGAGDCISCPAGTKQAHQICNPYDEDLVYLAIGAFDPHEVCVYPDSGKVMIRALRMRGRLTPLEYFDDEPDPPKIFDLAARRG